MSRDTGRERVYQAEFMLRGIYETISATGNPVVELDGINLTMPPEARFASVESVQGVRGRKPAAVERVRKRRPKTSRGATAASRRNSHASRPGLPG
jgi:putative metallohydrolase (TIGR04338 family)